MFELFEGESIKNVKWFEGHYAVTNQGRVWSVKRNKWLIPFNTGHYLVVRLSIDGKETDKKVHRLVGEAFIPNPNNKPQINHLNGNKHDNRANNLTWVTARENSQHACDLGLHPNHKLSERDKIIICNMYYQGKIKQVDIARLFHISPPGINYIIKAYGNQIGNA